MSSVDQGQENWRETLFQRLQQRRLRDVEPYTDIIHQSNLWFDCLYQHQLSHICIFSPYLPGNRLLDQLSQLRREQLKLSVENEQLRSVISGGGGMVNVGSGDANSIAQMTIAGLEKKLLAKQEELTELHKRKGENSQLIVDLNIRVEKQQQTIAAKEQRYFLRNWLSCLSLRFLLNFSIAIECFSLSEQQKVNATLKAEVNMLQSNLEELKKLNNTLFDEHTALQLAFTALEEKMRGVQVKPIHFYLTHRTNYLNLMKN